MPLSDSKAKFQLPSPLERCRVEHLQRHNIYFKRDDLIHPLVSGNKIRKLQGAISKLKAGNYQSVLTFGGAFSNHLVATAVICQHLEIESIGIVRTEELDFNNPTIKICLAHGMKLIPMNRKEYKNKGQENALKSIKEQYPDSLVIPEGGTSKISREGLGMMISEIRQVDPIPFDVYACSYGTGGTSTGILHHLDQSTNLWVFPAIKGLTLDEIVKTAKSLEIEKDIRESVIIHYRNLQKAFAKYDETAFLYAEVFFEKYGILLDPIYTINAIMGLLEKLSMESEALKICFVHTGGIQAWAGYFYRFPKLKEKIPRIYQAVNEILKPYLDLRK